MEESPEIKLTIRKWAENDRPREKLLAKGNASLSDAELLAIIIGSGNFNESAVDLAKRILHSVNNDLSGLARLSLNDLMRFKGIGEAKAIGIMAAVEIGRRRKELPSENPEYLRTSKQVYILMSAIFQDLVHEEFWVIYLNRANKITMKKQISVGGVSGTVVDQRIILKTALEVLASSLVLVHNHPSGNLKPSQADIDLTRKLQHGAKLLDLQVLDHLIIYQEKYFSFADQGMLP